MLIEKEKEAENECNKEIFRKKDIPSTIRKTEVKELVKVSSVPKLLRCELCENKFTRHCDMEIQLKTKHEECQELICTKCEKTLVTKWRLKKHLTFDE